MGQQASYPVIDDTTFAHTREKGMSDYNVLKHRRPHYFNSLGQLKNKYRNRMCTCGTGEKVKYCCGIKYN